MITPSSVENPISERASQPARKVHLDLFDGHACECELQEAESFLCAHLEAAELLDCDLPPSMTGLEAWMHQGVEAVGQSYHKYLQERRAGAGRRYFPTKSHALYFLKAAAPTKLVDGAWLYGVLRRWQDPRFGSLIKTYLEELGEGLPTKNHVVLYQKLLAAQGIEKWDDMADENYIQGAIQLSLAYHSDSFLPEVIGFNLGYEQLPLHLLITAYELKELGIDPYYFTLHVTVDNSDSGHAKQAVDSIFSAMPRVGDVSDWWRRVRNGYKLNDLGTGTNAIIESFDLEREMHAIFARKSVIGQFAHSDYRTVSGCTVNDWLSDPTKMPEFTQAMEDGGWFKRHEDPSNSRFWKLIQSDKAKMFGVFSAYEQQVIFDWIAGDWAPSKASGTKPQLSPEARRRLIEASSQVGSDSDFDEEERALQDEIAACADRSQTMARLISLMSPALHHSAAGLKATRIFNEIMG